MLIAALSVLAAVGSGIVTNIVTERPGWGWGIALAVLVVVAIVAQVVSTNVDHAPGGHGAPERPARSEQARAGAVPHQLPAVTGRFVGRAPEIEVLDRLADEDGVATVRGAPGVGKTTLALHWARRIEQRFPDGQLYVNLRGFDVVDSPMEPGEALRGFLEAFDVKSERMPPTLDGQAALYRSLLATRRVLVVLDNARTVDQVRPLLPGSETCFVIVTSRNQLGGLTVAEGAHPIALDLLTEDESRTLLARYLGDQRVAADPAAVDDLIRYCGRLPLALAVVAARAMNDGTVPLASFAAELRDEPSLLNALEEGDQSTSVEAVISWSYRALSPDAARLLRLIGLTPGTDLGDAAVASLAGVPPERIRPTLAELTRSHLVDEPERGRFRLHDLMRAFAVGRAGQQDPEDERRAGLTRLFDYYLHTGFAADHQLYPHRHPIALGPVASGSRPLPIADRAAAITWFTAEIAGLLAATTYANANGFDTHAWQLPWTYATFLHRQGNWPEFAASQETALEAAERLDDPAIQARVRRNLGRPYTLLGRADDARAQFTGALELSRQTGDAIGEALCHDALTWLDGRLGHHADAIHHAEQAHALYRSIGNVAGQARSLNYIGWNESRLGHHGTALERCTEALRLFRSIDNHVGQADTLDSLGYASEHLGDHDAAVSHYQASIALWAELGDRYNEADLLVRLGDLHVATGDAGAARVVWRQAMAILDEFNHPNAALVGEKLAGLDAAGATMARE